MEVVENYDIDGVHFDDYFYPNKREDIESFYSLEEKKAYENYGSQYRRVSDWRRDNVTNLIRKISQSINKYNLENNKNIDFGISPFGIWGHKVNHPEGSLEGVGSNTPKGSLESYNYQFADTRKWVKEEIIDYIAPQIYWSFDEPAAPYGELVNWWVDTVKDTRVKLYIGHGNYRQMDDNVTGAWSNPLEIANQLKYNKKFKEIDGSIFFRYKSLVNGTSNLCDGFIDKLITDHYKDKVRLPDKKLLVREKNQLNHVSIKKGQATNIITWDKIDLEKSKDEEYQIYRDEFMPDGSIDTRILAIIPKNSQEENIVLDSDLKEGNKYRYRVKVFRTN